LSTSTYVQIEPTKKTRYPVRGDHLVNPALVYIINLAASAALWCIMGEIEVVDSTLRATRWMLASGKASLLCCLAAFAAISLAGCSTTKPPTEKIAQADLDVRTAAEAKAADFAPAELQKAREKLARAKQAMSAQNYDEARRLAESAQVDAELAEAKADTAILRRAADQILRRGYAPPTEAERESREPLTENPGKE